MLFNLRTEGGAQVLSAGVRKTIQSIKEIVGNHSDADIYVALKETNMDPNETTQKLLNQDPFHEVKRKRDRKKENSGYHNFAAAEPSKNSHPVQTQVKHISYSDRNARRGGYIHDASSGASREFRVVRDNRINQNAGTDSKSAQSLTFTSEGVISSGSVKSNSTGTSGHQKPPVGRHSSEALNGPAAPADSQPGQSKGATSGSNYSKGLLGEKHLPPPIAFVGEQNKANDPQPNPTSSSNSYVLGVYSSSSDPVHVPSLHSRPANNVGAIRREVGVVGPRRQSSENSSKPFASQSTTYPNTQSRREGHSRESTRPFNGISKGDQSGKNMTPESAIPGLAASRSSSSNQHGSRSHQLAGHPRAPQPNKEWKPKSSLKPSINGPGAFGTPAKTIFPPADSPDVLRNIEAQMQDNMSRLSFSDNQNVIIAAHIRVSETDRCRLTFGSLGADLDSSMNSVIGRDEGAEELSSEASGSVSVSAPETEGDEPAGSKHSELMDDSVQSLGSNSSASGAVSNHLAEKKDYSSPQNLDDYADVELVEGNNQSYPPESLQQQDTSELPGFSGYDPQIGYDMSYFRPVVDEAIRVPSLPSSQEAPSSHTTNTIPASTIAMVQQQQQLAQMYPPVHVSHFANLMPYRQFISPVYVPPIPMPGYSNSPAYPHPSNGSSYLLMPGNSTHLTPSALKYGVQQFKPVPTGNPTAFGNFPSPTGYAISTSGGVGSTAGHEDSSRLKFKDSLYVPNPQAETSEIWMNPRDLPSLQSASYYNLPGQTAHAAYLPSHSSHASFNSVAAQSSHMQFPGMYHPSTQPAALARPHHLGPSMGNNVGVGVAAPSPGAQVGAYQQPQLGLLNWNGNF